MRVSRRTLLWTVPALLYAVFCFWYTDLRGPLAPDEIARFEALMVQAGDPPERIARLRQFMEEDTGRQFLMLNLLDMADVPPVVPGAPAGANADDLLGLYMAFMYPELFRRACHPVFAGRVVFRALDQVGVTGVEHWERAALMRYRSRRDMLEIAFDPEFGGRHEFKLAALEKTLAVPVEAQLYLGDPRLLLALLLLALLGVGDRICYGRR